MLKKIAVDDLRTGMYLQSLCGSWMDHPFWRTKFVIQDPDDIKKIIDSGITEVWINLDKGLDVEGKAPPSKPDANQEPLKIIAAEKTCRETQTNANFRRNAKGRQDLRPSQKSVKSMFEEARMGKAISTNHAGEIVQEISYP